MTKMLYFFFFYKLIILYKIYNINKNPKEYLHMKSISLKICILQNLFYIY